MFIILRFDLENINFTKMKDSTLLKISLIISLIGILALFFISESINIDNVNLNQIEDYIEDTVKIKGIVEESSTTESATFLKIKQYDIIDVVVFDSLNISKGSYVEVTGTVDKYNDEYEILAEKIRVR